MKPLWVMRYAVGAARNCKGNEDPSLYFGLKPAHDVVSACVTLLDEGFASGGSRIIVPATEDHEASEYG